MVQLYSSAVCIYENEENKRKHYHLHLRGEKPQVLPQSTKWMGTEIIESPPSTENSETETHQYVELVALAALLEVSQQLE